MFLYSALSPGKQGQNDTEGDAVVAHRLIFAGNGKQGRTIGIGLESRSSVAI